MRVRKRDNTYQEFNRDKIEKAVQAAIKKARICNKPVARYDTTSKTVTLR